jgi:hypothetical protein
MNGRQLRNIVVAGLIVAGIAIGGCGSSDSSTGTATASDTSSGPLTKAEFVKEAEGICRDGLKEKDAAVITLAKEAGSGAEPTKKNIQAMIESAIFPHYQEIIDQLGQLEPPTGDEAKVQKIVDEYEAVLQKAETEPLVVNENNPFKSPDLRAQAYGVSNCIL